MKKYILLVNPICKADRFVENAEKIFVTFFDSDDKFLGYIEMNELK